MNGAGASDATPDPSVASSQRHRKGNVSPYPDDLDPSDVASRRDGLDQHSATHARRAQNETAVSYLRRMAQDRQISDDPLINRPRTQSRLQLVQHPRQSAAALNPGSLKRLPNDSTTQSRRPPQAHPGPAQPHNNHRAAIDNVVTSTNEAVALALTHLNTLITTSQVYPEGFVQDFEVPGGFEATITLRRKRQD